MASYDNRTSAGYGRVTYPSQVRHPTLFDTEGRKHAVVGYAREHNYVAKSEQVVEFRQPPGMELYDNRRVRDEPILHPWGYSAHAQHHKDDEFSPGVHNYIGHGYSTHDRPSKDGEFFPKVHNHVGYGQNNGLPWNKDTSEAGRFPVRDHRRSSPRRDASDPSQLTSHGQIKGSPRSKDAKDLNWIVSPPSKDHYHGTRDYVKDNYSSDDEDDIICEDGVCYPKKGGLKPINHLKQEDYDKEKHRGHGYSPKKDKEKHRGHGYSPKKDPYYGTSYDDNEKHKGNGYVPSYNVPLTTQPATDTNSITNNMLNRPMVNSPIVNSLKPIKTRTDVDFPKENATSSPVSVGMHQPQYNGSPRKDQQDAVYNKASPQRGRIDSVEAARKYKGVLLKS